MEKGKNRSSVKLAVEYVLVTHIPQQLILAANHLH
jgi:hypothetical protein